MMQVSLMDEREMNDCWKCIPTIANGALKTAALAMIFFSKFDPGIFGVFKFERIFDIFLAIEFNNKVSQMEAGQEQFFFQLRPFKRRVLPIHQLVKKN